jgi:hypothetical protein
VAIEAADAGPNWIQNISGLPQGPAGRFRCILSLL